VNHYGVTIAGVSDSASYLATVTSNLLPVTFGYDPNGPLQQETVTAVQVHTKEVKRGRD
jgi:hypothetical protein